MKGILTTLKEGRDTLVTSSRHHQGPHSAKAAAIAAAKAAGWEVIEETYETQAFYNTW